MSIINQLNKFINYSYGDSVWKCWKFLFLADFWWRWKLFSFCWISIKNKTHNIPLISKLFYLENQQRWKTVKFRHVLIQQIYKYFSLNKYLAVLDAHLWWQRQHSLGWGRCTYVLMLQTVETFLIHIQSVISIQEVNDHRPVYNTKK